MKKNIMIFAAAALLGAGVVIAILPQFLPAGAAAPAEGHGEAPAAGGAPQAMPISVAAVLEKEVTEWSEFSGRLRAAEDVQVRPRVSGIIDAVHFKEGDLVEKGAKLFTLDLRPFQAAHAQAVAAVSAAEARNELTVNDKNRAKALLDERAISKREFDEKNNASKEAWAALKSAKAARDLTALDLEYAEITAPIKGRVGRADITVGNTVQQGVSVLTTIQSVDPVYADFDMDEQTYLRLVKQVRSEGGTAEMPVFMALADEADFAREGKIRSFDNQLSGDSGTIRVRAEFNNTDGLLTPGLFARVRLGGAEKHKAVLINDAAVGTNQDRKFVYVVGNDGKVEYRPVTLGPVTDGLRVIASGLAAGEKIIVNGLMRVQPGMNVQPMVVAMDTLKPEGAPAEGQQQPQQH